MKNFQFKPIKKYEKILRENEGYDDIKNQITKAIPFLEKNLDRLIQYLRTEENLNTYIEINLPFF